MACIAKLKVMNSQTGCSPASAAPTVSPQKPDSVIGESITLLSPNLSKRPFVTLYLPNSQTLSFRYVSPPGLDSGRSLVRSVVTTHPQRCPVDTHECSCPRLSHDLSTIEHAAVGMRLASDPILQNLWHTTFSSKRKGLTRRCTVQPPHLARTPSRWQKAPPLVPH